MKTFRSRAILYQLIGLGNAAEKLRRTQGDMKVRLTGTAGMIEVEGKGSFLLEPQQIVVLPLTALRVIDHVADMITMMNLLQEGATTNTVREAEPPTKIHMSVSFVNMLVVNVLWMGLAMEVLPALEQVEVEGTASVLPVGGMIVPQHRHERIPEIVVV